LARLIAHQLGNQLIECQLHVKQPRDQLIADQQKDWLIANRKQTQEKDRSFAHTNRYSKQE